jgi:hypothetical protein
MRHHGTLKYYHLVKRVAILLILVLVLAGCSVPQTSNQITIVPLVTKTRSLPTSTAAELPPTRTFEPTATIEVTVTLTPNATPTLTVTPENTPTYSPEPAVALLNQDTVCLSGASFNHSVQMYILSGSEFPVLGQISDQSWWLVSAEDSESCWIYGAYASVRGVIDDLPVMTPPPIPSPTATDTPSTRGVYYILISENTGGPFGCGDGLIHWYPGVWAKGDMETDIKAALNALFANHSKYTNGLYNPIYQSQLKAKGVEVVGNDVVVRLAGTLVRPKDACESQRMHDQIWYTVSQFSPSRAVIYLNNALLGDLLVVSK